MNIGNLPELLVSWLRNQGLELPQAGKGQPGNFQPGQQYVGKVLENLPSGRSLVQVGTDLLDMALPQQAKPGDTVRMTFLHATTRPTFVMQSAASSNLQPIRLSEAAQQVNALMRFAQSTAQPTPGSVPATNLAAAQGGAPGLPAAALTTSQPGQPQLTLQAAVLAPENPMPKVSGTPTPAVVNPAARSPSARDAIQAPTLSGQALTKASMPAAQLQAGATQAAATQAAVSLDAKPIFTNPVLLAAAPAAAAPNAAARAAVVSVPPGLALSGKPVESETPAVSAHATATAQGVSAQSGTAVQLLSQQLRKTLSESGHFYEAHLGRWVQGRLPLEAIQREPQARLGAQTGPLLQQAALEGMPEEAARLAGRQLMMLEGGPFLWQGMVWPGQRMEWLVEERQDDGVHPEDAMPRWRTQLRLTLPRLGEVRAELGVGAMGLQIRVTAPDAEALAEMQTALPEMVARMRAAELNLTSLKAEAADA